MDSIKEMMKIIQNQFLEIMQSDPDYYGNFKIILSNEQQYIKNKDRDINNIYIVVKFLSGSLNYGQTLVPVNFNALGQGNKIEVCQRLLLEYAQTFNLGEEKEVKEYDETTTPATLLHTYIIKQIYNQPQVMSNFNETWNNFRSLFYMAGTFLIGKDSSPIKSVKYYETASTTDSNAIDIPFVSSTWSLNIQLDTQAFYGTNNMTVSKSKIGTFTLNITTYFTSNALCNKIRAIALKDFATGTPAPAGIREDFYLKIIFADGATTTSPMKFKLADATTSQNIGEFPLMSATFTN